MRIIELNDTTRGELLESLLKRSPNNYGEYEDTVNGIIEDVRERGDEALCELTSRFDKWDAEPETLRVTEEEIRAAYTKIDDEFIKVIKEMFFIF